MLEAQSVIKEWIVCRVGSGTSVNVRNVPWLLDIQNLYVTSTNANLDDLTVSSLIITGENRWNETLVYGMFEERDVHLILSISLNQGEHDTWYWKKDRMGCYLVKTAYMLIQEMKNGSNVVTSARFWKRLWMLKVPLKVKHLMWPATSECLPVKTQLRQKHVDINVLCPMCNQYPETVDHVLLNCSFSRDCWSYWKGSNVSSESFMEWLSSTYDSWDMSLRQEAAMHCWAIWKCRNDLFWKQRST